MDTMNNNEQLTDEAKVAAVKAAVTYIVVNTKYSMEQVVGVIALADKWGEKAPYHFSNKQKKIYEMFVELLEGIE